MVLPSPHRSMGYVGGCHDDGPLSLQPASDWLLWLLLSSPGVCSALLKQHFDGNFIGESSISKSFLLSSLFWFMYSLIYLCTWNRGRAEEGGGWEEEDNDSYNALYSTPRERRWYICLLKCSATDEQSSAAKRYKALCLPSPPIPSHPILALLMSQ